MNFKKSLVVLSIAGILSMGIVNCGGGGALTVLKSGTYDCTNEKKEKSIFISDTSKHTWDYIIDGKKISDDFSSLGVVLVLSERDESTKSYELSVNSKDSKEVLFILSVNGTKFSAESKIGSENIVSTCIKR
jgi:hypothetical protein